MAIFSPSQSDSSSPNKSDLQSTFFAYLDNSNMPSARSTLIGGVGCLMLMSLLMVASASIPFAVNHNIEQLYFFQRQMIYMFVGVVAASIVSWVPLKIAFNMVIQVTMLAVTALLLVLTLAYGDAVNGSKRWLELGVLNFQVAELAKFVLILYTGGFVVRRSGEVRRNLDAFIKICILLGLFATLLLFQPDFGSVVIIGGCVLAMFHVAGAPLIQFTILGALLSSLGVGAIFASDYRMARVMSFIDPFDDLQGTDYQLSRSLIAFGRGEWLGVGYGESVQKLAHLPEAHTDFLLAITGEELGFFGVIMVLFLETVVIISAMRISYTALKRQQMRISYTAFGIATMFIGQTVINAGMNMGVLPTKGLTMPFFSYGGSSMLMCLVMVGLLLRFDKESAKITPANSRDY